MKKVFVGPHPPQYVIVQDNVNFPPWTAHQGLVYYSSKDGYGVPTTLLSPLGDGEFMSIGLNAVLIHNAKGTKHFGGN